jgi:hypothetical protein
LDINDGKESRRVWFGIFQATSLLISSKKNNFANKKHDSFNLAIVNEISLYCIN